MIKVKDQLLQATSDSGFANANQDLKSVIVMTFLAGAYVALGGLFAIKVGYSFPVDQFAGLGKLLFASVFPLGLMLVVICGADLFTGNCNTVTTAYNDRRIDFSRLVISLIRSWFGNFVGAVFVALIVFYSGVLFDIVGGSMPYAQSIVTLANMKANLDFWEAFVRAVGCNWLVCLAVYGSLSSDNVIGKIAALWVPTMAFVAIGFEHCVANMFFIPLAMLLGTDSTYVALVEAGKAAALNVDLYGFLIGNLLPVTLGNIVGGAVLVAMMYNIAYRRS